MKKTILIILGLILLAAYVGSWGYMIHILHSKSISAAVDVEGLLFIATSVAGIASALAIGVLGATKPGDPISFQSFAAAPQKDKSVQSLTLGFLVFWVLIGVLAAFYGLFLDDPSAILKNPDEALTEKLSTIHNALNTYGTTWLGMAVSSVLVLLGVNR